jgi:hypothetical protein
MSNLDLVGDLVVRLTSERDAALAERDRMLHIIDRAADRLREIDLEDLEEARILLGVRSKGHGLAVSHAITSVELAHRILAEGEGVD